MVQSFRMKVFAYDSYYVLLVKIQSIIVFISFVIKFKMDRRILRKSELFLIEFFNRVLTQNSRSSNVSQLQHYAWTGDC